MTASICDALIDTDLMPNCKESATGFEKLGILFNWDEIDFAKIVYKSESTNVVETLTLKDGAKGYKVIQMGRMDFNGTNTSANVGNFMTTFNNEVHLNLYDNGPKAAEQAKAIARGRFVLILEQKQKNLKGFSVSAGESAFRIYGLENGLELTECTNDPNSEDIGNGWAFTMTEQKASEAAIYMFKNDYETTKAQFESYL